MSQEPTILCPSCRVEIRLNESLAGPLVERARAELEQKSREREAAMLGREQDVKAQLRKVEEARADLDEQVADKLRAERATIAAAEAQKARAAVGDEIERTRAELATRNELLADRERKLGEAQKKELELLRQQRELEEQRQTLELSVERRLVEERNKIRDEARRSIEEDHRYALADRDKVIEDMKSQVEALRRKAQQGSQQLQGEVLELELESQLRAAFPSDGLVPVPKGEHGGDVLQRVTGPTGLPAGSILWEAKRAKAWQQGWLPKLRDDQRAAKAELAIVVSSVLPDGIESAGGFGLRDGVWVTTPKLAIALALCLRQQLLEVATVRQSSVGQKAKMEQVYDYLTSPRFGQRVTAIIESFTTMREDLDKEKRAIVKHWHKREKQIERALIAASGMYGDLQGIVGKSLDELEALDLAALEAPAELFDTEGVE